MSILAAWLATVLFLPVPSPAQPAGARVRGENGKYFDEAGVPTYSIKPDGTVDWYTYSGYRRYHAECHTCHGPDGEGSSFAPALARSLKTMPYEVFIRIVAEGRTNVAAGKESVMPAFGLNKNVMCYIDDIYIYLRARAEDALGRGRPAKHEPKPAVADQAEQACMGS
jgi:methanol metabolism-related c-type cytochrome